jgi:hypothetical protein
MATFIECSSLSISYNVMGIATISYTLISTESTPAFTYNSIEAGGRTFNGVVTNVYSQLIDNTENDTNGPWYSINVNLLATT